MHAITLNFYSLFLFSDKGDGSIELELKDMDLLFSWPIVNLELMLRTVNILHSLAPRSCSPEHNKVIDTLVEAQNIPEAKIWLFSGVSAFLYLYTSIHG